MMKSICTNNLIAFCGTAGLSKSAASASNNCRGRKQVGKERKRKPHMNQTPAQRRAVSHTPGKTNQPKHSLPLSYCRNIYSAFPDLGLASWQAAPQKESLPLASPSSAKQGTFPELCKGRKRDQTGCRSGVVFTWGRTSVSPGTHSREGAWASLPGWSAMVLYWLLSARNDTGAKEVMGSNKTYLFSFLNGDFFPFPTKHSEALKRIWCPVTELLLFQWALSGILKTPSMTEQF